MPYYGNSDENQNEYAVYAAFMCWAMQTVDSVKYVSRVAQLQHFIRLMTASDGKVYDQVDQNGNMYISLISAPGQAIQDGYGFITLTSATALLSGA